MNDRLINLKSESRERKADNNKKRLKTSHNSKVSHAKNLLEMIENDPNFVDPIIAGDES